ncbi:hypothetical protein HQ544_01655 [Candidatus Falkowbacteria bacterium]|nr:hypothetical protein [Candidatus Falkowbacteria bacterium]
MNKKIIFGGLAGLIILAGAITVAYAGEGFNHFKGKSSGEWAEKKEVMMEKKDEMQEIFANNDYEAWELLMLAKLEVMQEKVDKFEETINQETFEKMAEIHALMEAGEYEKVGELKEGTDFGGMKKGMPAGWRGEHWGKKFGGKHLVE